MLNTLNVEETLMQFAPEILAEVIVVEALVIIRDHRFCSLISKYFDIYLLLVDIGLSK